MTVKRTTKVTTQRVQPKRRKQTKQLNPRSAMPTVPKSVKNAYDLLGFVQQVIREEPLRYNQRICLIKQNPYNPIGGLFPSCGTVGCVAGWVATLKPTKDPMKSRIEQAIDVLGLVDGQIGQLFAFDAVREGEPQTPEHAIAGIAHIEAFRQAHKAQLQGQPV